MKSIVKKNNDLLTRKKLANSFSESSMSNRLHQVNSIDLRNNHKIDNLNNGFVKIVPINKSKRF